MGRVMSVFKSLVVSLAFIPAGLAAHAENIDQDTPCAAIVQIVEAPSPDGQKIKEVLDYTLQTMQAVDRLHGLRGQAEIFSQMPVENRTSLALVAVSRCRGRPAVSLTDTAIETYEAIRSKRASLGLGAQRAKQAQSAPAAHRKPTRVARHMPPRLPSRRPAPQNVMFDGDASAQALAASQDAWLNGR